jgi:hypothetical protein
LSPWRSEFSVLNDASIVSGPEPTTSPSAGNALTIFNVNGSGGRMLNIPEPIMQEISMSWQQIEG